jgi:hypothetical protein
MATFEVGDGARFWAYISPMYDTAKNVTEWSVTVSQGDWSGTITSANPTEQLQTDGLSGTFTVAVTGSGPNMPETTIGPQEGSTNEIGCNSNCASMVGIVSTDEEGSGAEFWTTWDAICSPD